MHGQDKVGPAPMTFVHRMFITYIIKSISSGKYYIGCTDNLDRRLNEHNKGFSKYTRNKGPWMLKYSEEYDTLPKARKREKQIKSWKKRKSIERLFEQGPVV